MLFGRALPSSPWMHLAAVTVPLLLILGLQYSSSTRLREISVLEHNADRRRLLEQLAADSRRTYVDIATPALNVPGELLINRDFSGVAAHFAATVHPAMARLFIGVLEECSCKIQFFDPARRTLSLDAPAEVRAAVLRVAVPWRLQQGRLLARPELIVDRQDPNTRIVYRVITDDATKIIGVAGLVLDNGYFAHTQFPAAVSRQLASTPRDVRDNIIVVLRDAAGRVAYATSDAGGRDDTATAAPAFAFDDWRVEARSRGATAGELATFGFRINLLISALMGVAIVISAVLTIRAQRRATRLSQLKTEFVSNVTHDLKTPLASIALGAEFFRRGLISTAEATREYGHRIETECHRLQQAITNILDISRIESGGSPYVFRHFDIDEAIEAALKATEGALTLRGFHLHYERAHGAIPRLSGDAAAITNALVNLIDNAAKYSGESKEIHLRVEHSSTEVSIRVIDFGAGIPAEEQPHIFGKFYRGAATTGHASGSGLGLAIVRHIATVHGGHVAVTSEPAHGSTFTISLPLRPRTEPGPPGWPRWARALRSATGARA